MGSAPAPGAVGRALAAHPGRVKHNPRLVRPCARVRCQSAPNGSRGGCAPQEFNGIVPPYALPE